MKMKIFAIFTKKNYGISVRITRLKTQSKARAIIPRIKRKVNHIKCVNMDEVCYKSEKNI